jgi:inositol transport system substrate-binding protein
MKKKLLLVMLTVMLFTAFTGYCAGKKADANEKKVAFICKGYSDFFCLSVMEEVKKVAPQFADQFTVQYFDGQMDAKKHNDLIETCVANGFSAIIFQQIDAEAPVNVVKDAVAKGVHVVVSTGRIEDGGASYYVDANPYQQGEAQVKYAIDNGYLDGKKVAIMRGPIGNFHADERARAFQDYLSKKKDCTVVATEVNPEWTKDRGMTIAQNWLVSIPDLDVILGSCDDMSLGAAEAVKMAGKQNRVKVFSIDGTDAGIAAVKDGSLVCTVQQDKVGYALEPLKIVSNLLKSEPAKSLNLDSKLISPENVNQF